MTECPMMNVYKSNKLLMTCRKLNDFYVLNGFCCNFTSVVMSAIESDNPAYMWHLRLDHISVQGLEVLVRQGIL